MAAGVCAPGAGATTWSVDTTDDRAVSSGACTSAPGDCALREAIGKAGSGDTVAVPAGRYTLGVEAGGDLDVINGGPITIEGAGARSTIVDGAGVTRDFHITTTVTITGLTITGGRYMSGQGSGGGIFNEGTATLNGVTVAGNTAPRGGGIFNQADSPFATMTLVNSTVAGNTASAEGGGVFTDSAKLTLVNSTISGNTAGGSGVAAARGGGIAAAAFIPEQGLVLRNATVHGNRVVATSGNGGNVSMGGTVMTAFRTANSVIAAGTAPTGANCDGVKPVSGGHNLSSDASCALGGTGDLVADPQLAALADAGGQTDTLRPAQATSPVLEAGNPAGCTDAAGAALTTDQRGVTRPLGRCDIGAVELAPPTASADQQATAITSTSATLGGSAGNPFIDAGTAFIEFGTTTDFRRTTRAATPALVLPAGAAAFAVTTTIGGLTPDTVYHYRVVATNGDGVARAPDATFRTLPAPVATPAAAPVAPVATPPTRRCASRRNFPIRLPTIPRRFRARIISAKVTLGKRVLAVVRGSRLQSKVNLKNLPKGTFTLKITMRLTRHLVARQSRTYHTCNLKLDHTPPPPKVTRG